jgi:hypothetical protein
VTASTWIVVRSTTGLAEQSPADETVTVTSRWRGSDCVWWPFAEPE